MLPDLVDPQTSWIGKDSLAEVIFQKAHCSQSEEVNHQISVNGGLGAKRKGRNPAHGVQSFCNPLLASELNPLAAKSQPSNYTT